MRARNEACKGLWSVLAAAALAAPAGAAAAAPANVDWRYYGNDPANTRYQDLADIDASNVAALEPAWVFHTGVLDYGSSFEGTPLVVDGTMFITTGIDDVFALDAATGTLKWAYHPQAEMPDLGALSVCCGHDNRGVAYGDGKVFIGRLDDVLVALDAATGEVAWKATVADYHDGYAITMAPQYVDGKVIVGPSGGEYDARGYVDAYDSRTGDRVWRFYATLPGDTWAGDSWKGGGGQVWTTPAVDTDLGLIYVTTANAAPDLNGSTRAGQNLYTASIVALDVATGDVRWYFQEVHHDLWDYDGPQPAVLFPLAREPGSAVPALGHCNKNGNYYILDRRDGAPLHAVREMPVPTTPDWQHPWPTQPVSSVEPIIPLRVERAPLPDLHLLTAPQYTPPRETPLLMQPGTDGGCEWPSAAYSPRTRFVYYGAGYEPEVFQTFPGLITGFAGTAGEAIPGIDLYGVVGATDTVTGRVAWKIRVSEPPRSGVLVVGDLVFFGENTGALRAVDARSGADLWRFRSDDPYVGGASAAPIAYVAGGREFIANAFGGNALLRDIGISNLGDAVIAFALPERSAAPRR